MMVPWSMLHQRSLPRPILFRMIPGTITAMVVLTCPQLLSHSFLLTLPHPLSPLPIHLPCQFSHLPIFHIIILHPLSPLSTCCQFPNLSLHQHQLPPPMDQIHPPCRSSHLLFICIIPRRFSLLRIVHIIIPLPSSPLLCLKR